MKTQSIIVTVVSGLVAFGLLLLLVQFLVRKFNAVAETEVGLKLSYSLHSIGILIAGSLLLSKALSLIPEGFEMQWALFKESFVLDAVQLVVTLIGLAFLCVIVIYFSVSALTSLVMGKRDEAIEMERDNFSYFLFRAAALVGLSVMAMTVLENFLRLFMPALEVSFYHG